MENRTSFRSTFHAWVSLFFMALSLLARDKAPAADHDQILWTAKWNRAGSLFAVGGVHALWVFDSNTLEKKSLLPKMAGVNSGHTNIPYLAVTRVAWHPESNLLAVSSQGNNVNGIYDIASDKRIPLTALKTDFGRGVSWSPDGSLLAFTSDDRLRISKADGTLLHETPRYKDAKGLTGVAWRPSGDRIVTVGARITLHDAQGEPIKQMMHRPEARERDQLLLCVAWHPSGEFFVVGDYGTEVDDPVLQFWSANGELLKSITLEGDTQIRDLSWNRDGSRLASASSQLGIYARDGKLEYEAKPPDLLWGVDWHPNGDTILTSSIDGRVTWWSSTARVVKEIVVPAGPQPRTESSSREDLPPGSPTASSNRVRTKRSQ